MSARRASVVDDRNGINVRGQERVLSLSPGNVVFHRNGIEFRSMAPFSRWREMVLTLESPGNQERVTCTGVVISCDGSRHFGYLVSVVFTSISPHAVARLNAMASLPV